MRFFVALNILIIIFIVLRKLMKGKVSCRVQYFAWIILPLFMLVGSFLSIPVAIEMQREAVENKTETVAIQNDASVYERKASYPVDKESAYLYEESSEKNADTVAVQVSKNQSIKVDYKLIAACLWVSVSAVIASVMLVNNIAFSIKVRKERRLFSVSEYGNLKVYKIRGLDSPFLLWNRIYIPEDLDRNSDHYALSVYHEYCHYKLGDCFWNVIKNLFVIVLWFDPLVWLAYFLIRHDNELAVDEMVIARNGEENRVKYGEMLLSYVSSISGYSRLSFVAASISGKSTSFMKQRILNIARKPNTKKYAAVIVCAVLITSSVCLLIKPHIVYKDVEKPSTEAKASSEETKEKSNTEKASSSVTEKAGNTVQAVSSEPEEERKVVNIIYPEPETGVFYDTYNLREAEDFKIPEDLDPAKVFVNCDVININEDYMYICIRGVDYEKNENIYRLCRYEMVDGKQGDFTGSIEIDISCWEIMNVYETDGKTYAIMKLSERSDLSYAFHIYELDFEQETYSENRVVYLDKVPYGYTDIRYAAYRDGTIYAFVYLHNGSDDSVYYEITEDGYTKVDPDDKRVWEYDRILFPCYKL